jgi:DNA-binding response OmpR family regulator
MCSNAVNSGGIGDTHAGLERAESSSISDRRGGAVRILVAEDDPVLASVVVEALSDEGHSVAHVPDLAGMRERASAERWDAFVLDSFGRSYSRLDEEYSEALRELSRRAPVIVTTGRAWAASTDARDLGVVAILSKPYDLDALLHTVQSVERKAGGAP